MTYKTHLIIVSCFFLLCEWDAGLTHSHEIPPFSLFQSFIKPKKSHNQMFLQDYPHKTTPGTQPPPTARRADPELICASSHLGI